MINKVIEHTQESGMTMSLLVDRLEEIKENNCLEIIDNPKMRCRYYEKNSNIIVLNCTSFNYPKLNRDDIGYFCGLDIEYIKEIHPDYTYWGKKDHVALFFKNHIYVRT